MNEYQYRVWDCINDKIVDFAMYECKSLHNVDIMYHHYIQEISTLFHKPEDHYSKIMVLAYNKTLKEYKQ